MLLCIMYKTLGTSLSVVKFVLKTCLVVLKHGDYSISDMTGKYAVTEIKNLHSRGTKLSMPHSFFKAKQLLSCVVCDLTDYLLAVNQMIKCHNS